MLYGAKRDEFVDKMVDYYHNRYKTVFSAFETHLENNFSREHMLRTYGHYIVERFKANKN